MNSLEWKSLLDEEPDNELLCFSYAKALMDEKQWALAQREFERLVSRDSEYAIAWAFLARCALQSGDHDRARSAVEQGMPAARKLGHDIPIEELEAVLEELDSAF